MAGDEEIVRAIESLMSSRQRIPLGTIKRWMGSDSIEVAGAVADLVTYAPYHERIEPPLSQEELEAFLFSYYERCMREDLEGEWAANRYGAAREIVGWFRAVPEDECVSSQSFLVHMKHWLAALYKASGSDIRTAIVTGMLEHVLEEPRWRGFFSDWRLDHELRDAYDEALRWAVEHEH